MRISVVIPCYNCESSVETTVNSIQSSGLQEYEIILVDDGSGDSTPAICDRLADRENIRCFHQTNRGVSAARNHGLQEARGEYIWFFDSDDLLDADCMVRAQEILIRYEPDVLIFGMSFDFYRDGRRYNRWDCSYAEEGLYSKEKLNSNLMTLYQCNYLSSSCNKLIKRSLLWNNGLLFDPEMKLMEDLLFVLKVFQSSSSIYIMPDVLYRYIHLSEKSGRHDNAVDRVSRIDNLERYMAPFDEILSDHRDVLLSLYYMLLEQRLRYQTPKQLAVSAEHFCNGPYSKGDCYAACPEGSKKTANMLLHHNIVGLYMNHRLRRKIVGIVKKMKIYRLYKERR